MNPLDPGAIYTGGGLQTYSRVPVPDSDGNIGQVRAINLTDKKPVSMGVTTPLSYSTFGAYSQANVVQEGRTFGMLGRFKV